MTFGAIGGAAIGLIGSSMGGGGGGGQTQSKEPWEAARPWLEDNIRTGQDLQRFYQQNPFNRQQQDAYNNIFSDQSNFRGNIAPGMMDFANRLMGTNYQRAPNMFERRPGGMSGGLLGGGNARPMGYGGQPMGNQPMGGGMAQPMGYEPAVRQPSGGPFSMPSGGGGGSQPSGGGIDFNAQNPYATDLKPIDKAPTDEQTIQDLIDAEMARRDKEREEAEYYFASGN